VETLTILLTLVAVAEVRLRLVLMGQAEQAVQVAQEQHLL
jgi:hypothetical protein